MNHQPMSPFPHRGLYVITRDGMGDGYQCLNTVEAALRGGAVVVQYRAKPSLNAALAVDLLALCRTFSVPFIINDDVSLAERIGSDGVHLGRDDVSLKVARSYLGDEAIIGVSCYDDLDRAINAEAEGASYVAFGRFFASVSKPNAPTARLETLTLARDRLHIPVVAIGGITASNAATIVTAGATHLAVIDAVFGQADPEQAARILANKIKTHTPC